MSDINIEDKEYPSPSGDEWFADSRNLAEIDEGIRQARQREVKVYSLEEIKRLLDA